MNIPETPSASAVFLSPERKAGQDKNASKSCRSLYLTDHLGSTRAVVDDGGNVLETFDYYPFGLLMPKRNTAGANTIEKFTGKERDDEGGLNLDYFGARYYDPALGRWHNADPLAVERPSLTPYNYARNNPLVFIDPDGLLDDYAFDDETGELALLQKTDDEHDRIVKTDKDGNIKRKGEGFLGFLTRKSERGKAKVAVDDIEKGILKDGINFKTQDNIIDVGGEGQATLGGVEDFLTKFSNYLGKEMSGAYLSPETGTEAQITKVYIDEYVGNSSTRAYNSFLLLGKDPNLRRLNSITHIHTHVSNRIFGRNDVLRASTPDISYKATQQQYYLNFLILTRYNNTVISKPY